MASTLVALGAIKEFDPDVDRITPYLERVALFLTANGVGEDAEVPAFLSIIGGKAYAVLRDLLAPTPPKDKTYNVLEDTLRQHYQPTVVVIAERFHFHRRAQGPEESVAEFLAELRRLAMHCDFKTHLNEALRDRLVCGLHNSSIQKKLLTKVELDLEKAVKIAQGMEAADRNAKSLKYSDPLVKLVKSKDDAKESCRHCGWSNHKDTNCRFARATCHKCGLRGHIAPVCPSRQSSRQSASRGRKKFQSANWVDTEESDQLEESNLPIYCVNADSKPIKVELEVNGKTLPMEVDTGAALSIISEGERQRVFPEVELQNSHTMLRTYTGEVMPVLGKMAASVKYKSNQPEALELTVVEGDGPTLLGRDWLHRIRLDWKQVGVVSAQDLPDSVRQLCEKYPDIFKAELGTVRSFKASIKVEEGAKPKFVRARSVPYSMREEVEKELERLVAEGALEPVTHSEWATPIVVIPKPDGRIRICGDFKVTLNPVMSVDQYPLPKPQDLYATLSGGKKFTTLDLSQAYHQLMLDEQAQNYCVINTHKGLYKYKRLPFGVASAPAIFQRLMDTILQGIPGVICYIDDIMVTGATEEEHLKNLEQVLQRLQSYGFRLKLTKCRFMRDSVEYLGLVVDDQGLHASTEKIEAVLRAPQPRNVKELRSFLGMMNYSRKFIPNLATILKPLTLLLQKHCRWVWRAEQARAFKEAKQLLTVSPVLVHYDTTLPLRLATDASAYGVGAVISHIGADGEERPIAFASRTLSSSECNYAQIEKEALGIVFGVRKFHQYLYGRKFTLLSDHKPLTTIFGSKCGVPALAAARLQRWAVQLAAYEYDIEFRPTARHANADGLSRLPLGGSYVEEGPEVRVFQVRQLESLPITVVDIRKATQSDKILSQVLHFTREGWPHSPTEELKPYFSRRQEISIEDNCLLWGIRVIIPNSKNVVTGWSRKLLIDQKAFKEQANNLVQSINEMGNPFFDGTPELLMLDTRNVIDESVVKTVRTIEALGKEQ